MLGYVTGVPAGTPGAESSLVLCGAFFFRPAAWVLGSFCSRSLGETGGNGNCPLARGSALVRRQRCQDGPDYLKWKRKKKN